jgi:hypothetical protein
MNPDTRSFYLQYLRDVQTKKADTYAVSGELDSNQTKFEYSSNKMKIGVFGPNEDVNCLLFILRVIVDKNYNLLEWSCREIMELDTTPDSLLKALKKSELVYLTKGTSSNLQKTVSDVTGEEVVHTTKKTKFYTASDLYSMVESC